MILIHHLCGHNRLSDRIGDLGVASRDSNYSVSDNNYGWGPDSLGSSKDIGNWWLYFEGPDSPYCLDALYAESEHRQLEC